MTLIRDNEGQYIMIKGSIQGEDITILNIYIYPIDENLVFKRLGSSFQFPTVTMGM